MQTLNNGQENRFLESPHIVKDTGFEGQMPFSIKNSFEGGSIFSKNGFFSGMPESLFNEQEKDNESDELNEKIIIPIPGFPFP